MEIATRLGIDADTCSALGTLARQLESDPALQRLAADCARALSEGRPLDPVEPRLGVEGARTFYLWLALGQVPAAEARRKAAGIDAAATEATFADLAVWTRHFRKQVGARGITLEILGWAQRYLRGDLVRLGSMQFEVMPFAGDLRVYRHRLRRTLSAATGAGDAIDLQTGDPSPARAVEHAEVEWELVLEPGMPVLDMHIPADSFVSLAAMARSIRRALTTFAARKPACACGEAWLLDPQIRALLPRHAGLLAIQRACSLYPSPLPEAATIRRLFGPEVNRARLASLPREGMNTLQRALADFLDAPAASLRARGGFIHSEELEKIEQGLRAGSSFSRSP